MALLSARQQNAEALTAELHKLGAFVVSPMPLRDNARLRFQMLDKDRDAILQKLSSWNWHAIYCNNLPRVGPAGMIAASTYEIEIPKRQEVYDDRIIRDREIATGEDKKTTAAVQAMLEHIGWYGKRK